MTQPTPMNPCPLCKLWEMMPYHKRWSTPTTPQECEGAMVAGWWAMGSAFGGESEFREPLCERHQAVMAVFNNQFAERQRVAREMAVRVAPDHAKAVAEFLERAKSLAAPPPPPKPVHPLPVIPTFVAAPVPAPYAHPQPAALSIPATAPAPIASMEVPVPPAVTMFPCPLCAKPISNGQVHNCDTSAESDEKSTHVSR